jgi:hypothetical protein
VSDLSELFEQLAHGPMLLATAFASVNVDCDNGTTLQFQACPGLSKPRQKVFPHTRVNMGQRETDPAMWFLTS